MPRPPRTPRPLAFVPFRGSAAVAQGLLTRSMLRGPQWVRLLPDVYVARSATMDHRTWCAAAAQLLPPGGAIGGLSAAYLYNVDLLPRDASVSVVVPRGLRMRAHPWLSVIHSTLPASDVIRFAGLPVTTPLRTAFDVGRRLPSTEAVVALDAMLNRRVIKLDELRGLCVERRRWPGSRRCSVAVELAEPLSESPMESRLRLLLIQAGLPRPVAQHEVYDARGRFIGRVDLAYPQVRLALEYEGDHHRDKATFRSDLARANALRAAGWTVLRFTADDVLRHPGRIIAQIVAVVRGG